jgi:hypothetical protein
MRHICTALLACIGLAAAADPAATPVVDLRLAEGLVLEQHATASAYGKLWADPAAAKLRALLEGKLADEKAAADAGGVPWIDPFEIVRAARGARLVLHGFSADSDMPVRLTMQADFGPLATSLVALVRHHGEAIIGTRADEAARTTDGKLTVARFGTLVVAATSGTPVAPLAAVRPADHDLCLDISVSRLLADLRATVGAKQTSDRDRASWAAIQPLLDQFGTAIAVRADLVASGIDAQTTWDATVPWLIPVDTALIGRVDAQPLLVNAIGIDGARLWADAAPPILASMAASQRTTPEALIAQVDAAIAALGVPATLKELVGDLHGTILITAANAAPLPTVTASVPAGPKLDALITALLTANGRAVPTVGGSVLFDAGRLPMTVSLIRETGRWTITSDPVLPTTWPVGGPGGFATSPFLARIADARDPVVAAASTDTPALLRLAQGYAGLMMGAMQVRDPAITQSVLLGLNKAAALAKPSRQVVTRRATGLHIDEHLMLPFYDNLGLTSMPIFAAIAIPNVLESRVTANENAAAAMMKVGIHVAQVQYSAGAYTDLDGDARGEYGTLDELTGLCPSAAGKMPGGHAAGALNLLQPTFDHGGPVNGYRFVIYLPDGQGGAITATPGDALRVAVPAACNEQEKYFIAYAWPEEFGDTGRRMFAITQDGRVHTAMAQPGQQQPAWNACLVPGTDFKDRQVAWMMYAK